MSYITVDGMFSGTGIRDSVGGGYLNPQDLGLSDELAYKISNWLSRYEDEHYSQYDDKAVVADLDAEGMEICKMLRLEMLDLKVEYYSAAAARKLSVI